VESNNKLYFGDNLSILREHVLGAIIDPIHLGPRFNSSATYNVLFKEKSGEECAARIIAFEDTWQWGLESEAVYKNIVTSGRQKLARGHGACPRRFRCRFAVLVRRRLGA